MSVFCENLFDITVLESHHTGLEANLSIMSQLHT